MRPAFAAKNEDHLFVKDDGFVFVHGTIGRRVSAVLRHEGIRPDVNVTATRVRKFFSSAAQKMDPVQKRLINKHMKHRETTADRNYLIANEAERSASAHKLMQDVMMGSLAGRDQQASDLSSDEEKGQEGDVIPPTPTRNPSVAGSIRTATAGHERYAGHDLVTGLGAPSTATPLSTDEQVVMA